MVFWDHLVVKSPVRTPGFSHVNDEQQILVGEITCLKLFYGTPPLILDTQPTQLQHEATPYSVHVCRFK